MRKKSRNQSNVATEQLMEMVSHMPKTYGESEVFVSIEGSTGTRKLNVQSKEFHNVLSKLFYDQYGRFASDADIRHVVGYVLGQGIEHQSKNLRYRVTSKDGAIYYDLCSADGCIRIDKKGWECCPEPEGLFKQYPSGCAQVRPLDDNSDLNLLRKYINISDDDWLLFKVYLVSCFYPDIQHPILNVRGSRGSGKSAMLHIIKSLVDPSNQPLSNLGSNFSDLFVQLSSCYFTAFDNISHISRKQSDLFCQVVTGGGIVKRELYTNKDTVSLNLTSLVAVNGILDIVRKDDLAQRTLFFRTLPMTSDNRLVNKDFWDSFEKDKPAILGEIFYYLAYALSAYPKIKLPGYHRLGDFDKLGCAIAQAENAKVEFLLALDRNEREQLNVVYDDSPLVRIVTDFMKDRYQWEGRMTSFYKLLRDTVRWDFGDEYDENDFPANSAILGKQMHAMCDVLSSFGIDIELKRDSDNYSYIALTNTCYKDEDLNKV